MGNHVCFTKRKMEELTSLLEQDYQFVKDGPAPELERALLQQTMDLRNILGSKDKEE